MLEAGDDSTMPGSAAPAVKMEQSQPSRLSSRIMARSPTRLPSMQPVQRPLIEQLPSQPPRVPPPSQPPPLPPGSDDATDAKDEVKSEKAADDAEMDAKPDTEVPGRPTREVTRFGEAPPSEGLAPSPASLMPEQSAPLSAMRGAAGDIGDVREDEQAGAAYDPKSCPIQSEKIPITTIYRPDLMPDRVEGSIYRSRGRIRYDIGARLQSSTCLGSPRMWTILSTAALWLKPACRPAIVSANSLDSGWERFSANQLEYLRMALDSKPAVARESFLRPETYDACQPINDANQRLS